MQQETVVDSNGLAIRKHKEWALVIDSAYLDKAKIANTATPLGFLSIISETTGTTTDMRVSLVLSRSSGDCSVTLGPRSNSKRDPTS